jgi:glucose/arabinose dehydrogenase
MHPASLRVTLAAAAALLAALPPAGPARAESGPFGDWTADAPGVRHHITPADLPPPHATRSASNGPRLVARPKDARPQVPEGFRVALFASDLDEPRTLSVAPNGDVFVAESGGGRIRVLRAADGADRPERSEIFADRLDQPFGIAFFPPGPGPQWVYVAENERVTRYPYRNGDLKARGKPETVVPNLPSGGHWTRDVVFSADGARMFVSVGSASNVQQGGEPDETRRADILEFRPDGSGERVFASGLRNPVGLAIEPRTGALWTAVNERDGLGDDLVPDYVTRVREGGFYGWPWYYIGGHQDPRHAGAHPELKDKVLVPDLLLQPHSAPMRLAFYTGRRFPGEWGEGAYLALHGSWNRARRTGYKVVRVPDRDGAPAGDYIDFMTGFVTKDGAVWGRPVGVATAHDGALLVSDDGGGVIWRVSHP